MGTFDLLFTLSKGTSAVKVEYLDVPTSSTMIGTINAAEESFTMAIDENADGITDSSRSPDNIQIIKLQTLYLPVITNGSDTSR